MSVSDWTDVESIYAGDDVTFAIVNGQVKVSGNSANFSSISDAKKLAVGESQVLVLKKRWQCFCCIPKGKQYK